MAKEPTHGLPMGVSPPGAVAVGIEDAGGVAVGTSEACGASVDAAVGVSGSVGVRLCSPRETVGGTMVTPGIVGKATGVGIESTG
jgi:hypothetical protein